MPFTISHAGAVLPFGRFLRRWRIASATVIGSMVPDFGLFWPGRLPRVETHRASALLTFSLPVGLIAFWVFQKLLKTPLIELLPDGAYALARPWAAPARITDARQWVLAASGILVGAVTHLVLDGFTHSDGRGVRLLPVLDDAVVKIHGHGIFGYVAMQQAFSIVGLAIVVLFLWHALSAAAPPGPALPRRLPAAARLRWMLALGVFTGIASLLAFYPHRWILHMHVPSYLIATIAVACLRGLAVALVVIATALSMRLR